jgi:NhaC family Na+:H+ antiporter
VVDENPDPSDVRGPESSVRPPSLLDSLIPLVALIVLIGGSLLLFGLDALDGPIRSH